MAIASDIGKYLNYHYTIEEFYHMVGDNVKTFIPQSIKAIHIIDDYVNHILPIIRLSIVMSDTMYYRIIRSKTEGIFHIRLCTYFFDENGENPSMKRDFLTKEFKMIGIENEEDLTRRVEDVDKTHKLSQDELDLYRSELKNCTIYLYDTDLLLKINSKVQYVFHNQKLMDVFYGLCIKQGIDNLLVSPFTNNDTIEQIIIPHMSFHKALQYLSIYYGIYRDGNMLYFGLNRNYFLHTTDHATVFENDEAHVVSILVVTSVEGLIPVSGKYKDGDTIYYRADTATVRFYNRDIEPDILMGNETVIISPYENTVKNIKDPNSTIDTGITNHIVNYYPNPYIDTALTYKQFISNTIIELVVDNAELADFTPNKEYRIIFDDALLEKKYRGVYTILSSSISIMHLSADYTATATIRLSRIK